MGCRRVVASGRCPEHSVHRYSSQERKDSKKFLNSAAWLAKRKAKLAETPWCEMCEGESGKLVPAIDVDHILPRHSHPELALEYSNLQSLCKCHHGKKTSAGL